MIFTSRLLKEVWTILHPILHSAWEISRNPDAPSLEEFLRHYATADAPPGFSWHDRREGTTYQRGVHLTYLYDLTVNQLQVTPAVYPIAEEVEKLNAKLWECVPPRFLDERADWKRLWLEAVHAADVPALRLILEQGFAFRAVMLPADWAGLWEKGVRDFDVILLRFVLERGFAASDFMTPAELKTMWFAAVRSRKLALMALMLEQGLDINARDDDGNPALFTVMSEVGGSCDTVKFLVKAGIELGDVEQLIQHGETSVDDKASAGDAATNANYLRRAAVERAQAAAEPGGDGTSGGSLRPQTEGVSPTP